MSAEARSEPGHVAVDASLAASASMVPVADLAVLATTALTTILDSHLVAVFTPELVDEWDRHSGRYGLQWQVEMTVRGRLRLLTASDVTRGTIDAALSQAGLESGTRTARDKDAHLVAIAIDIPAAVVSSDRKARNGYRNLCRFDPPWKAVAWFHVGEDDDALAAWAGSTGVGSRI